MSTQKVLVAGGSGMVGQKLSEVLVSHGYEVIHLSRRPELSSIYTAYKWDLATGYIDEKAFDGIHFVVNLAGEGIADQLWTAERKKNIMESRTLSAKLLLGHIKELKTKPLAYISSAAIGYYGDRADEWLHESCQPGQGFLAESCIEWEKAVKNYSDDAVRTVVLRIGIVLSKKGGVLEKMLVPLRYGFAPFFGNGRQWYSWIHEEDLSHMILFAMENDKMRGTYNAVAPEPVRNRSFIKTIVSIRKSRAAMAPVPSIILKAGLGEMATTVLNSTRVSAQRMQETGFHYQYPNLERALYEILK